MCVTHRVSEYQSQIAIFPDSGYLFMIRQNSQMRHVASNLQLRIKLLTMHFALVVPLSVQKVQKLHCILFQVATLVESLN